MANAKVQPSASAVKMLPSEKNTETPLITEDAIAQRAYALYQARGCEHGHDVEDWLRAERELQEANNALSPGKI
jgi:hypothetical protein